MNLPEQSSEITYIEEPELGFGHGQTSDPPKDGLYLYGPHSAPDRQITINVGVIGTPKGLEYFESKLAEIHSFVPVPPPGPRNKEHRLHLSHFAGLTEAFGIRVDRDALVSRSIASVVFGGAFSTADVGRYSHCSEPLSDTYL